MHELTIAPHGGFMVRDAEAGAATHAIPAAILAAYADGAARGMLESALRDLESPLPPSFEFARSVARLYLTSLRRAKRARPCRTLPRRAANWRHCSPRRRRRSAWNT